MLPEFEWSEEKRVSNIGKHSVDFEIAVYIWLTQTFDQPDSRFEYSEDRFVTFGMVRNTVLAVVWTPRGDAIRIISARKANRHEREAYHAAVTRSQPDSG
jgi:uncharacterized protein